MKKPDENMREILFRGKWTVNGEWIYGYYSGPVGIICDHAICDINSASGHVLDVDPATVGQYTGMKDKNGVRIFEGDIVRLSGLYWGGTAVVRYSGSAFRAYSDTYAYIVTESMTVIGNIYDSPELKED